jgi:hypothetical protein
MKLGITSAEEQFIIERMSFLRFLCWIIVCHQSHLPTRVNKVVYRVLTCSQSEKYIGIGIVWRIRLAERCCITFTETVLSPCSSEKKTIISRVYKHTKSSCERVIQSRPLPLFQLAVELIPIVNLIKSSLQQV